MNEVEVEAGEPPRFPDECIVCGRRQPDSRAIMSARFNGQKPLGEPAFLAHRCEIPCCTRCQGRLLRSRWAGKLVFGVACVLGAAGLIAFIELAPAWARSDWMMIALIGLTGAMGWAAVRFVYTPYFDFAPFSYRVVYSFRDEGYAKRFAELNAGRPR